MIDIETATSRIEAYMKAHKITISNKVQKAEPSLFCGTESFYKKHKGNKIYIYCHANGNYEGQVFLVKEGIGHYYENIGTDCRGFLGLPVSDEYRCDDGSTRSDFQGGYIKWLKTENKLLIYQCQLIDTHEFKS